MLVWKHRFPSPGSLCAGVRTTTAWRLFAGSPDVATLLTVVALGNSNLGSISLHLDSNLAEAWQTENFLGHCRPRQGNEEQWQVFDFGLLGR
jgi:hypothetical protein